MTTLPASGSRTADRQVESFVDIDASTVVAGRKDLGRGGGGVSLWTCQAAAAVEFGSLVPGTW